MQWENLTYPDFANAVAETGVCILTFGVVEAHGGHLPLGTDYLTAHGLACRAAALEPAVVFPPFYFGQIFEARFLPGAVALKPTLLIEMIQAVFDEIGRNGFKKIILVNGHGGNGHLLPFLAQSSLYEEKPYSLYLYRGALTEAEREAYDSVLETPRHGHACECETSTMLALHPEIIKMDAVSDEPGEPQGRLGHLTGSYSGIWWYADYPRHYAGDARPASAEKGRKLVELQVGALARFIADVKADKAVPALEAAFFERERSLRGE
jgi:creatinine amidohydrolase